ncbi:MAG: thiamine-phosphate kinase [Gammaproteobacteria bacterium]|nr:thiamine-phosphate kinase [Gammaproteobacteria bacterium]
MPISEFSLIQKYFANTGKSAYAASLSQGDDAAVVAVPDDKQVVMSMDTLIAGVHFPAETSAADIAYKALAVNLSDLAAMAAKPAWFLLSLTMPEVDEAWLEAFSQSLKQAADIYKIDLIGGDTCHGPLSISIQVTGLVDTDCYVTRSGARPGDLIVVSGQLGNAALGLTQPDLPKALNAKCCKALNRPTPRLCLTDFLQQYATAAIDLSDGLVGDLKHILDKSEVGAVINKGSLPVNDWIRQNNAFEYALNGGDDYELCLTISPANSSKVDTWNQANPDCPLRVIGEITESGYYLVSKSQNIDLSDAQGYQHFGK